MDSFAALADPVRRALLLRLRAAPARVVDLTDAVAAEHAVSRPAVSRHLRILAEAGLVTADEHGRERHYRFLPSGLTPVTGFTAALRLLPQFDEHALDGLDLEVRRIVRERTGSPIPIPNPNPEENTA